MKVEQFEKHVFRKITGVYFLFNEGQLCYIGQSIDILSRICSHAKEKIFTSYAFVECQEKELNEIEKKYIEKYTPDLNRCLNKKHRTEKKAQKSIRVYNKEKNRSRRYYNIFDIKKKYPHVPIDKIELAFNEGYNSKYEDHLLIIY